MCFDTLYLFGKLTMKRFAFCSLLLALSLHYGFGGRREITLETLPSNAEEITCTGDLQCNAADTFCVLGDLTTAEFPVLIPTDIRAKTVKKCNQKGCRLCVQVTMDMSVAFISEFSEELGSGDCGDYDDEDLDYYTEEDDDLSNVSLYIRVNKPSNDSLVCANLFILRVVPTSYRCSLVRVSLPQSSIPRRLGTNNCIKVGSVIYNSINARPGNDLNITSYTYPRYMEELDVHHKLPGCTDLDPKENILECEAAPWINITGGSHNMSVSVDNGKSARNTTLRVFHKSRHNRNDTEYKLYGDKRHIFPKSDIVPCLCFEAWYSDLVDGVRTLHCPFLSVSDKKIVRESALIVKIQDNTPLYNLSAPCNLSAEFSLCWKPNDHSECREIPNTRKEILSENMGSVKLENLHQSLCLQVSIKGEVIHTHCLPINGTKQKNEVLIMRRNHENTSFCFVGENKCVTLENATKQERSGGGFLDRRIVEDIIAGECTKIFKPDKNHEFYACNVEKYDRSRWNWSRALSLLAIACVVLILLLKNEHLKKWIKSVTTEKSLSEIFNNRRVLILYSPDNQEYESLVRVFASSLKGLQLDVVLDQWHRIKMSEIGPMVWYHDEKDTVLEKKGLIILLFSEEAREKYLAWKAQDPAQRNDLDPYQSFGAVLNCVEPDFRNKRKLESYIVATFSPSHPNSVPELFTSVPVYELPLCLEKFLKEIAGINAKKLGQRQLKRESNKIREKLSGKDTTESGNPVRNVGVELEPLVQVTSTVP